MLWLYLLSLFLLGGTFALAIFGFGFFHLKVIGALKIIPNNITSLPTIANSTVTPPVNDTTKLVGNIALVDGIPVGETQNFFITVRNSSNSHVVPNVRIDGEITNSSNIRIMTFNGTTSSNGLFISTWKIGQTIEPGLYSIKVNASAEGYKESDIAPRQFWILKRTSVS